MTTKNIAILANSIRSGNRCVAGKEVVREGNTWRPGKWIRLADRSTKEGAVPLTRCQCSNGGFAEVLDVIEVSVGDPCGNPNHPEDWFLTSGGIWKRLDKIRFDELPRFVDAPEILWGEGFKPRSVPSGYVEQMKNPASLYLIKPKDQWSIEYWEERVRDANVPGNWLEKPRKRIFLQYAGKRHEFDVTDPVFNERYQLDQNSVMHERKVVKLLDHSNAYLCLSLTSEWRGEHFKIAASIIERNA